MKKIFITLITLVLLTSCTEFQKVYNSDDYDLKYKTAWKHYEAKEYKKADLLFSQINNAFKRKGNYQRLLFAHAMSLYHMKYYTSAGAKFRKFTTLFPESSKAEEASYYIVLAYDNLSPKSSVDQAYTKRAVEEVESFMKKYPFSTYKKEINAIYKKLTTRLEKKDYDIAKNYYDLSYYKSAIVTFNNFLQNYSGSVYKERALFYRFKAAATLALKSVESKKEDRLQQAIGYYENYIKKYPKTEHKKEADIIKEKLVTQLTSKKETSVNK